MDISPFGVEIWMNAHEGQCALNLAETCVESLTIAGLLELAGRNNADLAELLGMKMTYGAIEGSARLRAAIAALYARQAPENVVVTHGTVGANALAYQGLVSRGDRVISVLPTYQQHYSIPQSIGADVAILRLEPENAYLPDLHELEALAEGGAKLIAISNPNNPTGALMDRAMLEEIAAIARGAGAWVLSDEVYRGTDQEGDGVTASIADLYERGISTAGMSKAFSLAGLRLGWIAGPREAIDAVMVHRDYNTISVGMLDDHFAALALENADRVLDRSRTIARGNLAMLSDWVDREPLISWVRPRSGTTALLRYDLAVPSRDLCLQILEETGVLLTPGSAMDVEGQIRIGYCNGPAILKEGLSRLSAFLARRRQ